MVKDYLNISRKEFLMRFFDLRNVLEPEEYRLTNKEIWLLTEILLLPEQFKYSRFGTRARKFLIKELEVQGWKVSQQGLVQFINKLEEKGMIQRDEEGIRTIHKSLVSLIDKDKTFFSLKFAFSIDNNK